ncbi:MAG TPA: M20/M25/M40 family metallo-hydrolase [Thermoanaerobaculia bacterium]|nr:M20/M25/M40 family metallo-hydrolase [Thermoanaerobaculia bacterium]
MLRRSLIFLLLLVALRPGVAAPAAVSGPPVLSEAARWLQSYLRIDTTNPPGNEGKAADFLADILRREGIAPRLLTSPAGRVSLWARISSPASGGRAVVLLHHMDVVAAGPGWTVEPFAGRIRKGRLWGRGAVDDKSLGIAMLAAFLDLKRRAAPLARDVVFLAVADEESGGGEGSEWLLAHLPELFAGAEAVIGEGGRNQVVNGRTLWWGVEVAQKRPLWIEVEASGRGGHGSALNPESANHQLVAGLARLLALPPRWRVTPPVRSFLAGLAPLHNRHWQPMLTHPDQEITETGPRGFLLPGMASLFLDTVQVTVLDGGSRINVIPDRARALVDIRLLPDSDGVAFLAGVRKALGKSLAVKVLVTSPPAPSSPTAGRVYEAVSRVLKAEAPVVPAFISGFTDSRFFRQRGIPAYGLSPFAGEGEDMAGIHGPDERISLAELDRGVRRMQRILAAYAAPGGK